MSDDKLSAKSIKNLNKIIKLYDQTGKVVVNFESKTDPISTYDFLSKECNSFVPEYATYVNEVSKSTSSEMMIWGELRRVVAVGANKISAEIVPTELGRATVENHRIKKIMFWLAIITVVIALIALFL